MADPAPPVEPVVDAPAATATVPGGTALVVADYHAGLEAALRRERGLSVDSRAGERREEVLDLLRRTGADRLVVLGDFMHSIGGPGGAERGEIEVLLESLPAGVGVTVVKGNHDGALEEWIDEAAATAGVDVAVTDPAGVRLGDVGFVHGHTWPAPEVLEAAAVCVGHEHPCVRLEDAVGGVRVERVWLRGRVAPAAFADRRPEHDFSGEGADAGGSPASAMVVFPAYNELSGGTRVNVSGQEFLAPFLPDGLVDGEAYLLDGTRLGDYRQV